VLSSSYVSVKDWLLNSGIYESDPTNENYGGVYSFFDENENKFSFLYPEITGYYISTMRFLFEQEKKQEFLQVAKSSAEWLIRIYEKYGSIIQGINSNNSKEPLSYSFDTGICVNGILDYYLMSNNIQYLEYSERMIKTLIRYAIENDGTILPFRKLDPEKYLENKDVWYKQKGCFHIKNSISFVKLYKITSESQYLEYAKKICNAYTQFQKNDGMFCLHQNSKIVNLHTLCYALEGLLYTYNITKNDDYLSSCKRALEWVVKQMRQDGSIELWFNSKYREKASYPIAQLIRLMILLDKFEKDSSYKKTIDKLYLYLLSFQKTTQPHIGGFYEEYYRSFFSWKKKLRINSWASMFSLQAIFLYENYEKINFDDEIELLF
jgi:rhamnogalacturonyl hydrolase YesR